LSIFINPDDSDKALTLPYVVQSHIASNVVDHHVIVTLHDITASLAYNLPVFNTANVSVCAEARVSLPDHIFQPQSTLNQSGVAHIVKLVTTADSLHVVHNHVLKVNSEVSNQAVPIVGFSGSLSLIMVFSVLVLNLVYRCSSCLILAWLSIDNDIFLYFT
jgi:hypothetical protein